jgi:anti-anti-sigma regulatory factor
VPHEPIPPFQVALSWEGGVATVTVTGEVDCATASALAGRLREVGAMHPDRLVLDLDGLFFTDVASARALGAAYRALDRQFPVILRAPRPSSIRRSSAARNLRAVRTRSDASRSPAGARQAWGHRHYLQLPGRERTGLSPGPGASPVPGPKG